MPRVSICIPQYNRCELLRLVLNDLLNQTYKDFELLVVDDASTDATWKVISEFTDPRIQYFRNEFNIGLYPNFNRCIELAQGEYIAIYHNHDRYSSEIVEKSVEMLNQFPNLAYVHTGAISYSPDLGYERNYVRNWPIVVDGRWFNKHLIRRWDSPVHQPTVMARREIYKQVTLFNDEAYGSCADTAVWIQMGMFADVGYIPLPLMRITPRQLLDRYAQFDWHDVTGMARAHKLGVDLLFGDNKKVYARQRRLNQVRTDRHYILTLMQCMAKDRNGDIQEGLRIIQRESFPFTIRVARFLVGSKKRFKPLYVIGANIYRKFFRLLGRIESSYGQYLSKTKPEIKR